MAATIRDVALRAGVSVATVSRALNQSGPVRTETRERIESAAKALNYRPNRAARSLITRRTRMLGVLLPDLFGEFFSELIRGIDQTAQTEGYDLLLSSSHDHADELDAALRGMHGRVDGLVVMAPRLQARVLEGLLPRNLPIVLLNSPDGGRAHYSLRIDSFGGARAMVAHLVGHGHRRIGIINGPAHNFDAQERLRGYRAALLDAGIAVDTALEVDGDFTGSGGDHGARALLRLAERPTAVFAANDAMAIGALSALREAGMAVPEAIALAGFDDVSSTRFMNPPLSSVHGLISELGTKAVRWVASELDGDEGDGGAEAEVHREVLPVRLVLRRSCGCEGQEVDWTLQTST